MSIEFKFFSMFTVFNVIFYKIVIFISTVTHYDPEDIGNDLRIKMEFFVKIEPLLSHKIVAIFSMLKKY